MSFVIGQIILQQELERRGENPEPAGDMIFAAVIGGLLGAKIYYAILTQDAGSLVSRAGFVFWGGLIGGIIAVSALVIVRRLGWARMSDVAGISLAGAYSVGRTGCWAVGDDYGRPFSGAWATVFPEGAPPSTVANMSSMFGVNFPAGTPPNQVVAVHPTQIYEVGMGFIMFLILWRFRDHKHAQGWLFGFYCALAGVERFIVEFFRAKDDQLFGGALTIAQVIALVFAAGGMAIMAMRWNVGPGAPGIYAKKRAA